MYFSIVNRRIQRGPIACDNWCFLSGISFLISPNYKHLKRRKITLFIENTRKVHNFAPSGLSVLHNSKGRPSCIPFTNSLRRSTLTLLSAAIKMKIWTISSWLFRWIFYCYYVQYIRLDYLILQDDVTNTIN